MCGWEPSHPCCVRPLVPSPVPGQPHLQHLWLGSNCRSVPCVDLLNASYFSVRPQLRLLPDGRACFFKQLGLCLILFLWLHSQLAEEVNTCCGQTCLSSATVIGSMEIASILEWCVQVGVFLFTKSQLYIPPTFSSFNMSVCMHVQVILMAAWTPVRGTVVVL